MIWLFPLVATTVLSNVIAEPITDYIRDFKRSQSSGRTTITVRPRVAQPTDNNPVVMLILGAGLAYAASKMIK